MRNKNFLDREQLEKIIDEQRKEISNLRSKNSGNKNFNWWYGLLISCSIISTFILIFNDFTGWYFVILYVFLSLATFSNIYFYNKEKKDSHEIEYTNQKTLTEISGYDLKQKLQDALDEQDYILAAKIRDEINKNKNNEQ